jgi:hypothetical protein
VFLELAEEIEDYLFWEDSFEEIADFDVFE